MNKKKIFFSLFFNDLLSDFGDTLYYLALMNYILLLPNSNVSIAVVTLSETLPIFFKILTGYLADRTKYKINFIFITQLSRFLIYLSVGFLISFKPALWIVVAISFLNILSDLAGQFENNLYLPIELQLIEETDREQVFATTQSIASTLNIIFKLSGAALVTWISYQSLAFFNAFTFLLCAVFIILIKTQLKSLNFDSIDIDTDRIKKNSLINELKLAYIEFKKTPRLIEFLSVIVWINGLFSIISPLIVAIISKNQQFIIVNSATTISLIGVILSVSSILGNITSNTIFKNLSLKKIIYFTLAILPLLFLSFVNQNIGNCYLLLGLLGIASGVANPKFYGFLMNNLSQNKIGLLTSTIGTIMQIGMIVSQLSFSLLIIYISVSTISWIYLAISMILLSIFIIKYLLHTKEKSL